MSTTSSRPVVEVVAVGSELLQGSTLDTNSAAIARSLRGVGLEISRVTLVGDDAEAVAAVLQEASSRAAIVITTGGLGPTEDDPTRQAVALATQRPLVYQPELWAQIRERFARFGRTPTENNRRQAFVPEGGQPLENPVGTAPAFVVELTDRCLIALPGVPAEMQALLEGEVLPYLQRRFPHGAVVCTRTVRTAGMGESAIDSLIQHLERLTNPTIGLSAHPGRVDIRVTARGEERSECEGLLAIAEAALRERLGPAVYGVDEETLEGCVLVSLRRRGWTLFVLESGTYGALAAALSQAGGPVQSAAADGYESQMAPALDKACREAGVDVGLGIHLELLEPAIRLRVSVITPDQRGDTHHTYGGPPVNASAWAVSLALDALRRALA